MSGQYYKDRMNYMQQQQKETQDYLRNEQKNKLEMLGVDYISLDFDPNRQYTPKSQGQIRLKKGNQKIIYDFGGNDMGDVMAQITVFLANMNT